MHDTEWRVTAIRYANLWWMEFEKCRSDMVANYPSMNPVPRRNIDLGSWYTSAVVAFKFDAEFWKWADADVVHPFSQVDPLALNAPESILVIIDRLKRFLSCLSDGRDAGALVWDVPKGERTWNWASFQRELEWPPPDWKDEWWEAVHKFSDLPSGECTLIISKWRKIVGPHVASVPGDAKADWWWATDNRRPDALAEAMGIVPDKAKIAAVNLLNCAKIWGSSGCCVGCLSASSNSTARIER